jgi:hypothetical protein
MRRGGIVDELCAGSDRLQMPWTRADVGYRRAGTGHLQHARVGELHLRGNRFPIPDSDVRELGMCRQQQLMGANGGCGVPFKHNVFECWLAIHH